jgi:hypothetical protein
MGTGIASEQALTGFAKFPSEQRNNREVGATSIDLEDLIGSGGQTAARWIIKCTVG